MMKYVAVFILSLAMYLLFVGSLSLYNIVTGIVVSTAISILCTKYLVKSEAKLDPRRLAYLVAFLAKYIVAEAKAHAEVTKLIIKSRGCASLNPGIVKLRYSTSTDYATAMVANSITNTPGTLVVEIEPESKCLYVHWLYVKTYKRDEMRKNIISFYEDYARRIFD